MKILSLFDGISIAQQALKNIGTDVEVYYASEIDKYAIQITQKNFPDTIQVGSVVGLNNSQFTDIDLLIGGSPCQDLSIAKKNREGLAGKSSGLFWEYVRILKEVKPKYFVLENVNSMPKEAKQLITETLGVEPIMINAALVSAQNRKRLFWVGKRVGDKYEKIEIPQPQDRGILLRDVLEPKVDEKYYINVSDKYGLKGLCQEDEKAKSMTASMYKGYGNDGLTIVRVGQIGNGGQGDRIYSANGKSVALSAHGGGRGAKTGLYAVAQRGRNIVDGKRKDILCAKTEQRIEVGQSDKAHTITSVFKDSMVMEGSIIRKLTCVECEHLQSLPDNFSEGISNTQRYKALGNGFNCAVIEHILKHL